MSWLLYYEAGFGGLRYAQEVRASALKAEFIVRLPGASGVIGRCDLPRTVGNVSRKHFSYRIDQEKLFITPLSQQGTAVDGRAVECGTEVEVCDGGFLVVGLSEAFYVFRETE
jgi:hypothetical protein